MLLKMRGAVNVTVVGTEGGLPAGTVLRGGVDRSANTTPGNKTGGLSNTVEEARGSIIKRGS